eukprot:TRINITY_DN1884_c0_g4_i1.p1 TRINITY_DN1884_c0_g4~~TRINITY_DN1884_c0_g4_i1.p1  ORF type:complete len:115 (+),score=0.01 TRINITY_DN1884_c0_g4_i1:325-669(+)
MKTVVDRLVQYDFEIDGEVVKWAWTPDSCVEKIKSTQKLLTKTKVSYRKPKTGETPLKGSAELSHACSGFYPICTCCLNAHDIFLSRCFKQSGRNALFFMGIHSEPSFRVASCS